METKSRRQIASLEVLIGGTCYGANATMYKLAFAAGFSWPQVVAGQMIFAVLCFLALSFFDRMGGKAWAPVPLPTMAKLAGLGMLTCGTSIFYCFAMTMLPVSVSLTLLFQFTWIGLVIQIFFSKRPPRLYELAAVAIILFGTVFASDCYKTGIAGYSLVGLACACLAALCCALFITLSGKVRVSCSSAQRGLIVSTGSLVLSLVACPSIFASGALVNGLAPYAAVTGVFGLALPVLFFGLGTPHLPASLSTVLAASELPAGLAVSLFVLHEPISLAQWLGVAVILAGIALAQCAPFARGWKTNRGHKKAGCMATTQARTESTFVTMDGTNSQP